MLRLFVVLATAGLAVTTHAAAPDVLLFPTDLQQPLERTCFQTGAPWSGVANLRSDVAIVYGIGPDLPQRSATWRDHGYRIHVMTGVAWGAYQAYLDGLFDGVNHQDERQTGRDGTPHSHGGDIYYMCPGTNYGKYLCVGIQRALDAGVEAIHLEEPEFWVQDGYEEGFKREWRSYYGQDWEPPHSSVDAQWRASKLKYFLYRRALQQIFDFVQDYNRRSGRRVRCYVPTHSLLNYAHWRIVSPESSLARLKGCDGYVAQVWTGTSRTPNKYRGVLRERTFETAFLEYGAMQNLVRATGRTVWYLNDPVEDNPDHTWADYQANWESTLTASLLQPDVWRFEVAPWPERVFGGRYPGKGAEREPIPPAYATELQTVMNALNDMKQSRAEWDCGTTGIGVVVSDSLMFERGDPAPSDTHLSHFYGLSLPLLKRGVPLTPVQLENVTVPGYLDGFRVLVLTYSGMKPLSPDVHAPLAAWVKRGGALVVVDDDADPFNRVQEWWNREGSRYATPREHLFEQLGISEPKDREKPLTPALSPPAATERQRGEPKVEWENRRQTLRGSGSMETGGDRSETVKVGKGSVSWMRENPARLADSPEGGSRLVEAVKQATLRSRLNWHESNYLLLRRGPYIIAAGLDESITRESKVVRGRFVNLFDPELSLKEEVRISPNSRFLLFDLDVARGRKPRVLASACKTLPLKQAADGLSLVVEGVADTQGLVLLLAPVAPRSISLAGRPLASFHYSAREELLWVRFANEARARQLRIVF